jgi:hypothetical protein
MKYFIDSTKEITGLDNLQILEEYSELEKLNEETLINKIQSILIKMNDISNENSKLIKITYPKKTGTKISTGRPIGNDNRKSKLISKLQSLQIILAVTEVRLFDHNVADDLMNKIMRYALSIQADVFVTPRYVRVI